MTAYERALELRVVRAKRNGDPKCVARAEAELRRLRGVAEKPKSAEAVKVRARVALTRAASKPAPAADDTVDVNDTERDVEPLKPVTFGKGAFKITLDPGHFEDSSELVSELAKRNTR